MKNAELFIIVSNVIRDSSYILLLSNIFHKFPQIKRRRRNSSTKDYQQSIKNISPTIIKITIFINLKRKLSKKKMEMEFSFSPHNFHIYFACSTNIHVYIELFIVSSNEWNDSNHKVFVLYDIAMPACCCLPSAWKISRVWKLYAQLILTALDNFNVFYSIWSKLFVRISTTFDC